MTVDGEWASHCLHPAHLGTTRVQCKVVKELSMVREETDACDGWSIRDRLFEFLVQAITEQEKLGLNLKRKKLKKLHRIQGQIVALSYTVALMDNPYNPDVELVLAMAKLEVDGGRDE